MFAPPVAKAQTKAAASSMKRLRLKPTKSARTEPSESGDAIRSAIRLATAGSRIAAL